MGVDTSIYNRIQPLQIDSPYEAQAKAMQFKTMQNQNRLADLAFGEKQRELAGDNALARLLSSGMKGGEVATGLAQAGYGAKSLAYTKQQQELEKQQADIGKVKADTNKTGLEATNIALTQHRDTLNTIVDPNGGKQWLIAGYQNPQTKAVFEAFGPLEEALKRYEQAVATPEGFQRWKTGASLNAEKLVQYTTPDANARLTAQTSRANNAATNATSSANNAATNATSRANNAATIAAAAGGKDKPPTEFQGKAAGFGARAQEADRIITSIEGKYNPAAINAKQQVGKTWLVGGALEAATDKFALTPNDQMAEQAQRDFINAVLRQESGAAIADSEFENAKKQYFPQPGQGPEVIAQKARNRKLAIQGFTNSAGRAAFTAPPADAGDIQAQADAILRGK